MPTQRTSVAGTWIVVAVLAGLGIAGCGGGGGGGANTGDAGAGGPSAGIVVDPYIVGAVFQEVSADGATILQERSTPSDLQGQFSFPRPLTGGSLIRMRLDARGTHAYAPFDGLLKRRVDESASGALVVSPLTTLLANGATPELVVEALLQAGLTGVTAAELKSDPMAGLEAMTSGVTDDRLRLLRAAMAVNAMMTAVGSPEIGGAELRDPGHAALLEELASAAKKTLNARLYEQLAAGVSGLTLGDLIRTATQAQRTIAQRIREDLAAHNGNWDPALVDTAVRESITRMPLMARGFYETRTGSPTPGEAVATAPGAAAQPGADPVAGSNTAPGTGAGAGSDGKTVYDGICVGCHKLGSYDASGFAPDLAGKGSLLAAKIQAGHQGVSLSAGQLAGLAGWVDQQGAATQAGAGSGNGTPDPGPVPGPAPAPGTGAGADGKTVYDGICVSCHKLGSYDASGFAPDLAGKGSLVAGKIQAGHQGISLSAAQLAALASWIDQGTGGGASNPPPTPAPGTGGGGSHPTGQPWIDPKSAQFHGRAAQQNLDACRACHGADLSGGAVGVGCYTCHFGPSGNLAPAGSNWAHGTIPHGAPALADAVAVCAACHNRSRLYGNGPAPCHDCHTAADHPVGQAWVDPKSPRFHGTTAWQNLDSCRACHGTDLTGGSSRVSCYTCHFGPTGSHAPAGSSWAHGTIPHNAQALTDAVGVCAACHTRSRLYGNGPAPCHDCHTAADHPIGQAWVDPKSQTFHGTAAQQGLETCKGCHGSDLKGGSSAVSCYTCHFGPTGSHAPVGSTWTHGTIPHGDRILTDAVAVCTACHDRSRIYGNGPAPCHDCHTTANHPVGQAWLDPKSQTFHGVAAQQGVDACKACHGGDFKGGSSAVSCYTCHFGPTGSHAPAGSAWTHGTVPHSAQALTDAVAVCTACHDQSRQYGNGPAPCHDCHTGAAHPVGQAWLDPKSTSFHGAAAQKAVDSCAACHGSDFKGGSSRVSCYTCHFGPTGTRSPTGSGWGHATGSHSGLAGSESICTACHTLDRSYGNGPAACHDCHAGPSHPVPYPDHRSAANIPQACTSCHGASLQGASGPACTTCHTLGSPVTLTNCTSCHGAPPNGAAAPNRAGAHAAHAALPEVRNTCTACHQGAGTQTAKHFDGVTDVVLSASFQAKTGVLAYSSTARTCGAVSCHGGQTTPTWLTGTIDVNVNAGCRSCHVSGTTQYNSYSSGRHGTHSSRSCTDCHDTVLLAPSHFSGLATSAFEQTARSTIKASLNYNGSTCSPSCHGNESWR